MKGAFEPWNGDFGQRFNPELQKLLREEEYDAASRSTQYAHYTSPQVIQAIWQMARRMGFSSGRVIEPSMGTGLFFGLMPQDLARRSELVGIEMDPISGGIAKCLYPDAQIAIQPYQKVMLPDNTFDLAVGNVPFGSTKIFDPHYDKPKLSLHNYFIIRTLDKLAPGALMLFLTSRYSLDSSQNADARELMADRADLIAALRLPDNAFKQIAGTEVVADLLIFKKRAAQEKSQSEPFQNLTQIAPEIVVNEYFARHPENVLGEHSLDGKQYARTTYTVTLPKNELAAALEVAVDSLPENIIAQRHQRRSSPKQPKPTQLANQEIKEGSFLVIDGEVKQRRNGLIEDIPEELNKSHIKSRIRDAVRLREQLKLLLRLQLETSDDRVVDQERLRLNDNYDRYVARHGYLHGLKTSQAFEDDPEYPLLLSLENYDPLGKSSSKATIFEKRTAAPYEPLNRESFPTDTKAALSRILAATGKVDLELMATMSGKHLDELVAELEGDNLLYRDPLSGQYLTADQYLSGDVRQKLHDAEAALALEPAYARNVEALKKVQPDRLSIHDIEPKLGQTWVPINVYIDFIRHLAKEDNGEIKIHRMPGTGEWKVSLSRFFNTFELRTKWSAGGWMGHQLCEAALNQRMATCYQRDKDGNPVFDAKATMAAREMQHNVKTEFKNWARVHEVHAPQLEEIYNNTFNNIRLRQYDGSHLEFPGMNPEIKLMSHQVNFVWRLLQEGRGLAAHVVGAGKTYESIAAAMEMRRMGLSRKNLFAVPNNMLPQWRNDWLQLYPGSNVLAVTDNDFNAKNRQKLLGKIATGDYDGIILTQSAFDLLSVSPELEAKGIQLVLKEAKDVLTDLQDDERGNRRSIKLIEKQIEKMENRLAALHSAKADRAIYFDQLGVTTLFVDEAHKYKNLVYFSRMGQVAGLSNAPSQRASRMKLKTDYMLEHYGNRGVAFLTGTPITNTLGEMYNMTRYVAPELLINAGIRNFDDWAANFGNVVTALEYSPDGVTFKAKNRFSEFTNLPELQTMFNVFADVKMREDLPHLPSPQVNRHNVMVPITPAQAPMLFEIVRRGEALNGPRNERPDPKDDNWLKLSSDARKISLDPRLYDYACSDGKYKSSAVADKIVEVWQATQQQKGTQLIFSDFFSNRLDNVLMFHLFRDIKERLVKSGIPASEIALIEDYDSKAAKESVFRQMRAGEIRILMGSTEKMGVGVNVQKRLKGLHHLDQPWRPADVEQREGRIIRQGNDWSEVDIYRYISEPQKEKMIRYDPHTKEKVEVEPPKAYDLQMFQKLETKQRFINQIMSNKSKLRTAEDPGGAVILDYATMKAVSTGNPDAMRKVHITHELMRLSILHTQWDSDLSRQRQHLWSIQDHEIPFYQASSRMLRPIVESWKNSHEGEIFSAYVDDKLFTERKQAAQYLDDTGIVQARSTITLFGVAIPLRYRMQGLYIAPEYVFGNFVYDCPPTPSGLLASITGRIRDSEQQLQQAEARLEQLHIQAEKLRTNLEAKSPFADPIAALEAELGEVNVRLGLTSDGRSQTVDAAVGEAVEVTPENESATETEQQNDTSGDEEEMDTPSSETGLPVELPRELQTSGIVGPKGRVCAPNTEDGIYQGTIVAETKEHYLQKQRSDLFVLHAKTDFDSGPLVSGTKYAIYYSRGNATTREIRQQEPAVTVPRDR